MMGVWRNHIGGSVVYDGTIFLLHVHVIAGSSPEAEELRRFRDRLRTDPNLVASYIASKKAILASGITDSVDYCTRKGEFVQAVPWTKPDELPFDAKKKNLPGLGGIFGGNFNMALADGSVHYVAADFDKDIFRAMITRSGGEVVDINKLNKTPKQ